MKITYRGTQKRYEIEKGDKFGKLTVIQKSGVTDDYRQYFLCECECGNEVIVLKNDLIHGRTKSCGCITKERCRLMGVSTRKYPNECSHCGATPHYAKGLCRNCYTRQRHSGTVEYYVAKPKVVHEIRTKKREFLALNLIPKTDKEKVLVENLYEDKTYAEIGEILGVSKQRVDQMIRTMCKRQFLDRQEVEVEE